MPRLSERKNKARDEEGVREKRREIKVKSITGLQRGQGGGRGEVTRGDGAVSLRRDLSVSLGALCVNERDGGDRRIVKQKHET